MAAYARPAPPAGATSRWFVLAVMSVSVYLVAVNNSIINAALPSLAAEFNASNSVLQWFVDSYILVFASLLLLGGTIGDRFGRRRALAIGMAIHALGAAGAALAPSPTTLILMRGVQGAGAALVMPPTLSILTSIFERQERAKAIGIWTGVSGMGFVTGPALGGSLVTYIDWTAIFWVGVAISGVSLIGLIRVPESRDSRRVGLDVPGAVLATSGIFALVYGLIEGNNAGWASGEIAIAFTLAAVLLATLLLVELRSSTPMLPLKFFKQPAFVGAVLIIGIIFFAFGALGFFMQQYFQVVQGHSAFAAGLRLLPMGIVIMVVSPLSGALTARLGPRLVNFAGGLVALGALLLLAQLSADSDYWPLAFAGIVLVGLGGGLGLTPLTDTVMASIPVDDAGIGSAMNDTSRELGNALGIAVLGSVASGIYSRGVTSDLDGQVPQRVADGASEGVVVADTLARSLDAETAALVTNVANVNFTDAFTTAFMIGAAVSLVSLAAAVTLLPRRARARQATRDGAAEPRPTEVAGG